MTMTEIVTWIKDINAATAEQKSQKER